MPWLAKGLPDITSISPSLSISKELRNKRIPSLIITVGELKDPVVLLVNNSIPKVPVLRIKSLKPFPLKSATVIE